MGKAVIVSAVRTAVGKHAGQWTSVSSENLAAATIKEAVIRSKVDPKEIEDVVYGNIYGPHGNHARIASLIAGIPVEAAATTVDRQCGSGTQAIINAVLHIEAGYGDVFVAGGVEHMTLTPYQLEKSPAYSWVPPRFMPSRLSIDEIGNPPMPQTADILAKQKGVDRKDCDEWACISQSRASKAVANGTFKDEIVPIPVKTRAGVFADVAVDECPRPNTTLEDLAKLKPLYEGGVTTAGNACPRSDGAAALVIVSEERAKAFGLKPLARVRTFAVAGLDPNIMGYGPVPATTKALKRSGLSIKDIDVTEMNEAFAGQFVPCLRDLNLDPEKTNPNGGAIALGHPLGGTGAVLTVKLLYEMQRKDYSLGLVTMCIGGGQGMAVIYERC